MKSLRSTLHTTALALLLAMIWVILTAAAAPGGDIGSQLNGIAASIESMVRTVGLTIFLIAVAVAGIMRMVAFGNERRIALSNMALTAAVVGLIIMLLAVAIRTFIDNSIN